MASDRDCGDRQCSLDYRFVQNCVIYISENSDQRCNYPCSTDNCVTELHHFIMCPTWSCTAKTTTTTSTPAPDMSTLSPLPTHPSNCSNEVCVPSLVFNVLFGIMILAAIGLFLIRRRRALAQAYDFGIENPFFTDRQGPIIRHSERLPLLSARRDSNPGPRSSSPSVRPPNTIPNFFGQPSGSILPGQPRIEVQETAF